MLLTIGLLTKNSEDTVQYALRSVLGQNIESMDIRLELVVIDGYSTDNTLKVVKDAIGKMHSRFGSRFVRHVIRQEKIGLGYARNLALEESTGDWILWLDSDNILAHDYIFKALQEIEKLKDTNTAVLYPRRVVPVSRGDGLKLITCYEFILRSIPSFFSNELISRKILCVSSPLCNGTQGSLFKTEALREVGGFNRYLLAVEDIDACVRLLTRGYATQYFNSTLYYFTRRTLDAWFKQAMLWGYWGKIVRRTYEESLYFSPCQEKPLFVSHSTREFLSKAVTSPLLLRSCVRICGIPGLLIPLTFIYRRVGYIKGYLRASRRNRITRR